MSIRVTHDMFVSNVFDLVGSEYTVLSIYKKAKENIKMKHNKCGYEYQVTPDNFKRGRRCPQCANIIRRELKSLNIEELRKIVYELVKDEYTLLEDKYVNARTPVKMKHNKCGYEWNARPNHFVKNGTRCPECADKKLGVSRRKSQDDFCKEVSEITNNEYKVVGFYVNAVTKIDILHNICGNIYNVEPNSFLNGNRCNFCKSSISKGEVFIKNFLQLNNINFTYQHSFDDCINKNKLPFDFAILDSNGNIDMLIEYDGRQHFEEIDFWGGKEEFERIKLCDSIKNNYCINNNIKLIRIPYWDYDNLNKILNDLF